MGRDLFSENASRVGVYRARYSYYLGLVAGTRLPYPYIFYTTVALYAWETTV